MDVACPSCDTERTNVRLERGESYPLCDCGTRMEWLPSGCTHFEWGGPRFINGIDQHFNSRSDMLAYLKRNGLAQAPEADKAHGARNEYGTLGASYSYRGQGRRSDYSPEYGRRRS